MLEFHIHQLGDIVFLILHSLLKLSVTFIFSLYNMFIAKSFVCQSCDRCKQNTQKIPLDFLNGYSSLSSRMEELKDLGLNIEYFVFIITEGKKKF
ncbi:hypothetical protein BpHYR1_044615 [Brachionus plicatilis]|uniref:Uncharacterized protein n=1 Tax=Brachionus plicatilis TaxID=10195 RepID=A0A3M7RV81_BRAPC|nr:hypothetical protein BpHYR1_044615 [Brachionus plicatilis]